MTVVMLAPTERGQHVTAILGVAVAKGIEVVRNTKPEQYGVDVLWSAAGKWWGAQRKTISDLVASMDDGRLAKETAQVKGLSTVPWLVVEGRVTGETLTAGLRSYTTGAFNKSLMTLGDMGWRVVRTESARDTGLWVVDAVDWSKKHRHGTATSRPKAVGKWGKATNKEYQVHLLQGFEGVGPDVARAMVDRFGCAPLAWTVSKEELMTVEGIGKVRAERLMEGLGGEG